jgi:hypothetical protein
MAAAISTPLRPPRATPSARGYGGDPDEQAGHAGPAREVIGEMAWLLRDTRGSMLLGGGMLSAVAVGIGLEAAFSPSVPRPGLAGLACAVLLGGVILCWIRAAALLLLAGRPVLGQLNDSRWRTGAPVDPRVRWLTLPPMEGGQAAWNWTQVNLLLGAARIRRERVHLADTWTFIAAAAFGVWTAVLFL